jgi:metal-responsive CopG/Arc/MetJ family transcriptional regulator
MRKTLYVEAELHREMAKFEESNGVNWSDIFQKAAREYMAKHRWSRPRDADTGVLIIDAGGLRS